MKTKILIFPENYPIKDLQRRSWAGIYNHNLGNLRQIKGLSLREGADGVQMAAEVALEKMALVSAGGNPDLEVNIKNIYAQAYLSFYYAEKIRGASANAANRNEDAKITLGKVDCHWKNYVNIMDRLECHTTH